MELYALLIANPNPGRGQLALTLPGIQNDANVLSASLQRIGAKVTLLMNATARQVNEAVQRVSSVARKNDRVVFWYSGHVVYVERLGATVPVFADTELETASQTFDELAEIIAANLLPGHLAVLIDAYSPVPDIAIDVADHSSFICFSDEQRANSEFAQTLVTVIDRHAQGSIHSMPIAKLLATNDLFEDVISSLRHTSARFRVHYVGERLGAVDPESKPALDDDEWEDEDAEEDEEDEDEDDYEDEAGPPIGGRAGGGRGEEVDYREEDEDEDEEEEQSRVFRVWFGTNRNRLGDGPGGVRFGARRSSQTSYGSCEVVIPKSHLTGSLGSRWWWRLLKWDDDRVKLLSTKLLERDAFLQGVVRKLRDTILSKRFALIYIHGFNVSFVDAARRAAQIGFDLGVRGVTSFFSWPSRGRTGSYLADGAAVGASEAAITEFIRTFVSATNAEQVHILAHSMGNRALLRTIEHVVNGLTNLQRMRVGQIILAAPDVDCDEFANLAKVYKQIAKRTTMYISAKDRALATSGFLHEYPRAGILPPVTCVPGIDTVEATNVDLSFLGHSHYAEARALIYDMHALIHKNDPPDDRAGLDPAFNEKGEKYWKVRA